MAERLSLDAGLPEHPVTLGSLLRGAFGIWSRNLFGFSFVALVVYAPIVVFWLSPRWIPGLHDLLYGGERAVAGLIGFALVALASQVATAAVTYGVIEQLAGRRTSVGAMIAVAVRRGPGVLLVAVVVFLATMAGVALLVVPGVILSLVLAVAVPVAVVERPGVLASLKRSAFLTRGHRWKILGLFITVNALGRFVDQIATGISASIAQSSPLGSFFVSHLAVAFMLGLPAVAAAIAYHDLRFAKEGTDTAQLAKVFE